MRKTRRLTLPTYKLRFRKKLYAVTHLKQNLFLCSDFDRTKCNWTYRPVHCFYNAMFFQCNLQICACCKQRTCLDIRSWWRCTSVVQNLADLRRICFFSPFRFFVKGWKRLRAPFKFPKGSKYERMYVVSNHNHCSHHFKSFYTITSYS